MPELKSAQQAIDEFVDAIAQHYLSTKDSDDQSDSVTDEFVSAIEQDLKETLRDRLSAIDTVKEVEATPTAEFSESQFNSASDATASPHQPSSNQSLSNQQSNHLAPDATVPPDSSTDVDGLHPTMASDIKVDPSADVDLGATMDTGVVPSAATPVVRSGSNATPVVAADDDFSHDDMATMDSSQSSATTPSVRVSEGGPLRAGKNSVKVPPGYEVLSTLGKGGMGIVYKARHVPLNRLVAVKMIISGENASDEQIRRFQIEAEAAAHLSHPNIVSVYEVGEYEGLPFFSLEFVEGQAMSDLLRETTMSAQDAAKILIPVARAIDYSHNKGVLHRDLKPQNILVTPDGVPKVADFGLAKRLDNDDPDQTRAGVILGTPGYMAPEQARSGDIVGPQTDVYALGCILYYVMTGRPPFVEPTPFETVRALLVSEPVAPSKLQNNLDKDLETICLKALEKDVDRRYASAGEFADELERFLKNEPIVARPITRKERLWKWCKRNPRVATLSGIAASLLLCVLFGGIISAVVINEQKKAEQVARADAEESEQVANDQAELALDTTRLILYEAKEFFKAKPELRPLRQKMITSILSGVEKIHTERYENDVQSTFVASADCQLGQIYLEAGEFEKSRDKLLEAQRKLIALNADGTLSRADVSQMNITRALGDSYRKLGETAEAEEQYRSLLSQREKYFETNTHFTTLARDTSMAEAYGLLGSICLSRGKRDQALEYVQKSLKARRDAYDANPDSLKATENLSSALSLLSQIHEKAGDFASMVQASTESLELQSEVAEFRSDIPTQHNTALKQKTVARQCLLQDKFADANNLIDQAVKTYDRIIKLSDDHRIVAHAADSHYWKGIILQSEKKDAAEHFGRAEEIQRMLISKSDNVDTQGMLLKILAIAGKTDTAIKLADQLASMPKSESNCGYSACGYAAILETLSDDDQRRNEIASKAVEMVRKLIGHGYTDFKALRETDRDFAPLHQFDAYQEMLDEEEAKVKKAAAAKIANKAAT